MARITVEDCVEVKNRFELVALASQRAAGITRGAPIKVDKDNDKPPVIALREIAGEKLDLDRLREELITNLQTRNKVDIIDDENLHAENQDTIIDELDLEHESIHIFEDDEESTDFDVDSFDDNTDEDK